MQYFTSSKQKKKKHQNVAHFPAVVLVVIEQHLEMIGYHIKKKQLLTLTFQRRLSSTLRVSFRI